MSAPNYLHIVERLSREFPTEFRNAHRKDASGHYVPEAHDFIRRLAWTIRQTDPSCGLNAKRGDPNDQSMDALAFKGGPAAAGGIWIVDVISAAGTDDAEPAWTDVTQQTIDKGDIGGWIEPQPVGGSTPTPTPTPGTGLDPAVKAVIERHMDRFDAADPQFVHRVAYASWREAATVGQKRAAVDRPISDTTLGIREAAGMRAVSIVQRDGIRDWRDHGIVGPEQVWVMPAPIDLGTPAPVPPVPDPPVPVPPVDPPSDPLPPVGDLEARVANLEAQTRGLIGHVFTLTNKLVELKQTLRSV